MRDLWKVLGLLSAVMLLPACSGDAFNSSAAGDGSGTAPGCVTDPTDPACDVTANSVIATTDKVTIKSDGFDEATITATVLDTSRAAIEGATVTFEVLSGKLSTAVGKTDENGQVKTKFSASPDNPSNGVAVVTARVSGAGSFDVPVTITGTTLELTADDDDYTLIVTGASTTREVYVKAADSAGLGVYGVPISFSLAGAGGAGSAPAGAAISPNPATTDISGSVRVTLTGVSSGDLSVIASALGTTDTGEFLVLDSGAFQLSSSVVVSSSGYVEMVSGSGPAPGGTGESTITATASTTNMPDGSVVWFTTSVGDWTTGTSAGLGLPYTSTVAAGGTATATLRSASGDNGFATVYAFIENNTDHNDALDVAMSPPVSDAAQIIVQTDEKSLARSTATTTYSTKVRVQVRTNDATGNYPIANAPVSLELQNATGGGEHLAKGFGYTDVYGNFETTFVSGTGPVATGQIGPRIFATVADPTIAPAITSSSTVEITGIAGSVALGTPRVVQQTDTNDSINTYVMSALVADGTGAAVSGATVTLHVWPSEYRTGYWTKLIDADGGEHFSTVETAKFPNEDIDEDGILDPGEDTNQNGQLDPQNSYAGTIPPTVTTGNDGSAPFNYVYLKDAAEWVTVRAQGSTRVFGTEATTSSEFVPHSLKVEVDEGRVNDSPFRLWLFIDISDATGIAYRPDNSAYWVTPDDTLIPDVGAWNGSDQYVLPVGTHVAGDLVTVAVRSGINTIFSIYIRFVP